LTWEPDIKVNDDNLPDNDQVNPGIAVDKNGYVLVAWRDERGGYLVYYAYSKDFGRSFTSNIPLNQPPLLEDTDFPYVISNNGDIYIQAEGKSNGKIGIYILKWDSITGNFNYVQPITHPLQGIGWWINIDNLGYIHAVDTEVISGQPVGFFYLLSKDLGNSWEKVAVNVTGFLDMDAKDGIAYVVWAQQNGLATYIYFTRSVLPREIINISLNTGWNFVSIPGLVTNTTVESVFSPIKGKYDSVKYYDAFDERWKTWSASVSSMQSPLQTINYTIGFWIRMLVPATLQVNVIIPMVTDIHLKAGWNMVGYPSNISKNITEAFGNLWGRITKVQEFNFTSPYYLREMKINDMMEIGRGYWIYTMENVIWRVWGW
jgi:hypothetical protein